MIIRKIAILFLLPVITISCTASLSASDKKMLSDIRKSQISFSKEINQLKNRILILESGKRNHNGKNKFKHPKHKGNPGYKTPDELPEIKLKPTKSVKRENPKYYEPENTHRRGRVVVLKLTGVKTKYSSLNNYQKGINNPINEPSSNYGKRLRLGKFYNLREPDGKRISLTKNNSGGEKEKYKYALNQFRLNRFALALTLFTTFAREYPNSKLYDNALFWKGECFYKLKKYHSAILLYKIIIVRYKTRNKAPDAMFKMALSYINLGNKKKGRSLLAKILEIFPSSGLALKAARILKKMR